MLQSAMIESLPAAFWMMKAVQAQGVEGGGDYRTSARAALKEVLEARMGDLVSCHLDAMPRLEIADRRNDHYWRWLTTELAEIELYLPRTRSLSVRAVLRAYARRALHIDHLVQACFVLGVSTRKVATALLLILGRRISPATVDRIPSSKQPSCAAMIDTAPSDVSRSIKMLSMHRPRRSIETRMLAACKRPV